LLLSWGLQKEGLSPGGPTKLTWDLGLATLVAISVWAIAVINIEESEKMKEEERKKRKKRKKRKREKNNIYERSKRITKQI